MAKTGDIRILETVQRSVSFGIPHLVFLKESFRADTL